MRCDISDETQICLNLEDAPIWLRQATTDLCGRTGLTEGDRDRLEKGGWLVYGYADLGNYAIACCKGDDGIERFNRRVFYRHIDKKADDYKEGNCPSEAAAPGSIKPGVWGLSPYKEPRIGVRIPTETFWELNSYTQLNRLSLTEVVAEAITAFMSQPLGRESQPRNGGSLQTRVLNIEERLDLIEQQLGGLGQT
jgi:hypothetical protein